MHTISTRNWTEGTRTSSGDKGLLRFYGDKTKGSTDVCGFW